MMTSDETDFAEVMQSLENVVSALVFPSRGSLSDLPMKSFDHFAISPRFREIFVQTMLE